MFFIFFSERLFFLITPQVFGHFGVPEPLDISKLSDGHSIAANILKWEGKVNQQRN